MADTNSMISSAAGIGGNIIILLVVLVMVVGVGILIYLWLRNQKQYSEFECRIWGKDGFGNVTETIDRAGIFIDKKTGNKRLFLKKNNVGLEPDNIPYIFNPRRGYNVAPKIVYMLRTGLKNFHYIKPEVHNPNVNLLVSEEDVNWGVNAYERVKKMFNNPQLMQIILFSMIALISVIILVLFIQLFKKMDVLQSFGASMDNAAQATKDAAQALLALQKSQAGAAVVP